MSMFDLILSEVGQSDSVGTVAQRLGMTSDQVEAAITALGAAHVRDGDTISTAATATGFSTQQLNNVVSEVGGTDGLAHIAKAIASEGGIGPFLRRFS